MAERETWTEGMQALGTAVLDLMRAEVSAAMRDVKTFFRQLGMLLAVAAAMLLILVYVPFIVLTAAMDGIRSLTGWPVWGSALLLLGLVLLFMGLVALVAYALIVRRMQSPVDTVKRRLDDHRGWWRHEVFEEPRRLDDGDRGALS